MTDSLAERVRDHCRQRELFGGGGTAILAVSGGGDSLALLGLLVEVAAPLALRLEVAHVDHGIHAGSAKVADRVAQWVDRLGLPIHRTSLALGQGTGETAARHARYRWLRDVQARRDAPFLVTAHHADDQIETVMFRVLKGSGPAGLAGMSAAGEAGLRRPLLPFRRAELRAWAAGWCRDAGLPIDDPANTDLQHDRVWIRHTLLQLVRERMGAEFDRRILDLGGQARADREAWAAVLNVLPGLDLRRSPGSVDVAVVPLRSYDKSLTDCILQALARDMGAPHVARRFTRIRDQLLSAPSGRRFELGGGWTAEVVFDRVRLTRSDETSRPSDCTTLQWETSEPGAVDWEGWHLRWKPERAGVVRRDGPTTWVTPGDVTLRAYRPGDRMVPFGGIGHRPVRRLLMERRIERGRRDTFPVVVRRSDIVWLPGLCRSDRHCPEPGEMAVRLDVGVD